MGEKAIDSNVNPSIEQLQEINDELNERNQKLAAQIKEMGNQYQELIIKFNKSDRLLGKVINKIGIYESKLLHCEIVKEDMEAELNGYIERAKAAEVPANDE